MVLVSNAPHSLMYICICHGISDREIRRCASSGANCLGDLQRELGVATQCGRCREAAEQILSEHARYDCAVAQAA